MNFRVLQQPVHILFVYQHDRFKPALEVKDELKKFTASKDKTAVQWSKFPTDVLNRI